MYESLDYSPWAYAMLSSRTAGALNRVKKKEEKREDDEELLREGFEMVQKMRDYVASLISLVRGERVDTTGDVHLGCCFVRVTNKDQKIEKLEDFLIIAERYADCLANTLRSIPSEYIDKTEEFFDKVSGYFSSRIHRHRSSDPVEICRIP